MLVTVGWKGKYNVGSVCTYKKNTDCGIVSNSDDSAMIWSSERRCYADPHMRLAQIDSDYFLDNDRETVTKRSEQASSGSLMVLRWGSSTCSSRFPR